MEWGVSEHSFYMQKVTSKHTHTHTHRRTERRAGIHTIGQEEMAYQSHQVRDHQHDEEQAREQSVESLMRSLHLNTQWMHSNTAHCSLGLRKRQVYLLDDSWVVTWMVSNVHMTITKGMMTCNKKQLDQYCVIITRTFVWQTRAGSWTNIERGPSTISHRAWKTPLVNKMNMVKNETGVKRACGCVYE